MHDTETLATVLAMARRALAILEEQAAGYTALTIPAHLQIELEAKRREVAELEAQVGTGAPEIQRQPIHTTSFGALSQAFLFRC